MACLLPPEKLTQLARAWLEEDIPSFDAGGAVVGERRTTAHLFGKADGVLAGCPFFDAVFELLGCSVAWEMAEGSVVVPTPKPNPPTRCAIVTGPARRVLMGERIALNVLARASGIASRSATMANIGRAKGWSGRVAGTRKTTPGFRLVEKHAMLVGGVDCHRMDLSSMVMLKDNHVDSAGSITAAVRAAKSMVGFSVKVEVECGSEAQAREAIEAGAEVVMLDNFEPELAGTVSASLKRDHPAVIVECSGGITVDTIASYMHPTVDIISTSWVHQGCPHIDFSLKVRE